MVFFEAVPTTFLILIKETVSQNKYQNCTGSYSRTIYLYIHLFIFKFYSDNLHFFIYVHILSEYREKLEPACQFKQSLLPFIHFKKKYQTLVQITSVAHSHQTLCDPMDCSMPGFPVHHQLPELTQTVHLVSDAIQSSHLLSSPFSSCLQPFPESGSFPMNQFFSSGSQSIENSASASVLPMNIQD